VRRGRDLREPALIGALLLLLLLVGALLAWVRGARGLVLELIGARVFELPARFRERVEARSGPLRRALVLARGLRRSLLLRRLLGLTLRRLLARGLLLRLRRLCLLRVEPRRLGVGRGSDLRHWKLLCPAVTGVRPGPPGDGELSCRPAVSALVGGYT
jgi:hypothetical protein